MSNDKRRLSDLIIPIGFIEPKTAAQASVESTWVDMEQEYQVLCVANVGVVGTTLDLKLQQATDASGTSKKDITGKAIVQISTDDEIVTIECSADEMDSANGFTFLAADLTTVGATTACSVMLFGGPQGRYQPSTSLSAQDIKQTIT